MNLKLLYFKNPLKQDVPGKFYPYPVYEKTIGLDDFVEEISHSTPLTPMDVRASIMEVIDIFHRYMVRGHKVKLDGIGTFKVSFKGAGEDTTEDVTASNIDRSTVRITFVADSAMKQEIKSKISFSKISERDGGSKDK